MRDWVAQSASWRKAGGVLPGQMLRLGCWYKFYNPKRSSRWSLLRLFTLPYRRGNFLCDGKAQCCRGVGRRTANKKLVLVHFWRLGLRMASMAVPKRTGGRFSRKLLRKGNHIPPSLSFVVRFIVFFSCAWGFSNFSSQDFGFPSSLKKQSLGVLWARVGDGSQWYWLTHLVCLQPPSSRALPPSSD